MLHSISEASLSTLIEFCEQLNLPSLGFGCWEKERSYLEAILTKLVLPPLVGFYRISKYWKLLRHLLLRTNLYLHSCLLLSYTQRRLNVFGYVNKLAAFATLNMMGGGLGRWVSSQRAPLASVGA